MITLEGAAANENTGQFGAVPCDLVEGPHDAQPFDAALRQSGSSNEPREVVAALETLAWLCTGQDWDSQRHATLNAVVTLLCTTIRGAAVVMPSPSDSVALHLRVLGYLAKRVSSDYVGLPADQAARLDRLVAQLVIPA